MRSKLGALMVILVAAFLAACDGATPTGTDYKNPDPVTVATATPTPPPPTPTPRADLLGLWKIANTGNLGPMEGYAIEITSHNLQTGEVRGRSVLKFRELNGLLRGTVRGNHIDWQVDYTGQGDTENGSMDLQGTSNMLTGSIKFEFNSIGWTGSFTNVWLRRE